MKKIILILILLVLVIGCSKNNDARPAQTTPTTVLMRIQVVYTNDSTDHSQIFLVPNQ